MAAEREVTLLPSDKHYEVTDKLLSLFAPELKSVQVCVDVDGEFEGSFTLLFDASGYHLKHNDGISEINIEPVTISRQHEVYIKKD